MIWTNHYFVHQTGPNTFEVIKYSDNDIPDHFGTVNIRSRTVNFHFFHKPNQDTINRYLDLVDLYVKQGMPSDRCYMFESDGIRWNRYGDQINP